MRFISVILCLLIVKGKSSYFDDFKGALFAVESSFGKLLNDVVSDVKSTVHCTILAMEQVLAVNGVGPEPTPNNECYSNDDKVNFDIDVNKGDHTSHNSNSENMAQEIHSSICKVNKTLSHILESTGHERIEDLKRELKHEHNRLAEVGLLLRIELEKISGRMKREFPNIDLGSDNSSLDSVWNNMKLLYEVEKNDKNSSKEIGEVLNEALNVLHMNSTNGVNSDEEKINVIMKELEQESSINNVSATILHHELLLSKDEKSALQNNLGPAKLIPANAPTRVQQAATNALNNVQEVATDVLSKVQDVAESALSNVENVAKAFSHSEGAVVGVADYIMDRSNSFVNSNSSIETSQTHNNLSNTILQRERSLSKDEQSALQNNLGLADAPTKVQQATNALKNVSDEATDAFNHVQTVATNALNKVQDVAESVLSNVGDVAKEAFSHSDKALKEAAEYITDKSSNCVNSNLSSETSQTPNTLSNTILHRELSVLKDEQSALQNNLEPIKPKVTPTEVQQAATNALTKVSDVATNALNKVQDVAKSALNHVEDVAKEAFSHSDKALKEVADYITDKSSSFVNSKTSTDTFQTTSKVTSSNKNFDPLSQFNFGDNDGMGFLRDALKSQELLDNFFAKHANDGTSAFGNPALFNSKFQH